MGLPKRKLAQPEFSHEPEANDNESPKEFEKKFLRDYPHFNARHADRRALSAFRHEFKLGRYEDMNIFILMNKGDRNISAERVFASDDENNVVFYSTTGAIQRALAARGHEARKANLEQHVEGERADIFIMLDPAVSVTPRLLKNVLPGGLVLCRIKTANALRAQKYSFKAIIDMSSSVPVVSRHDEPSFWEEAEVATDKEFQEASQNKVEGVVTYAEAKQALEEAGIETNNVIENYKKLIETDESLPRLPTKPRKHENDIVVMKKGLL